MTKCAAIQMASSPHVGSNLLEAEKLIAEAAKAGAKLVALPENFAIMGLHETDKVKAREKDILAGKFTVKVDDSQPKSSAR